MNKCKRKWKEKKISKFLLRTSNGVNTNFTDWRREEQHIAKF